MKYIQLYKPRWLNYLIRKYFKKHFMKKYLKKYPGAIYKQIDDDGVEAVVIDLTTLFEFGTEPSIEELDEMADIYESLKI